MLGRDLRRPLLRALEVGVQATGGRLHDRQRVTDQALALGLVPRREAVAPLAVVVHVHHVRAGRPGGHRDVALRAAGPPLVDLPVVGGRVQEAVLSGGLLAALLAREHRPAVLGVGVRRLTRGGGAGRW